jgi:fructuronate reductase
VTRRLDRAAARVPPPAPVRVVHLGLGGFHRSHQAWYTMADPEWGIAAYTFRAAALPRALTEQDGLYTLLVRGERDTAQIVSSISRAHPGADRDQWLADVANPEVAVLTLTVTESAYQPARPGEDSAVARLVAGLRYRWRTGGPPLAVVPCDNVPGNGAVLRRVVNATASDTADDLDPAFPAWLAGAVSFVDTVVDRITPASTDTDRATASALIGREDAAPVVAEPFTEWLLAGDFPAGRPEWERCGAAVVDDVRAYQQRKLWLLNGAHTLLAYGGLARGLGTIAEAVADPELSALMETWWDVAAPHTGVPAAQLTEYRQRLRGRFAAPGIRHQLAQIAVDGSAKIPARILPVLRRERSLGRPSAHSAAAVLAGWLEYLRGPAVRDARAAELVPLATGPDAVAAVLAALDPELAQNTELLHAVREATHDLSRRLATR